MVARPKMTTSVHARVADAEKAHAEVVRAVGRGASALRDDSQNVIEMTSGSTQPTLMSVPEDVAVQWNSGTLAVVDPTTAEKRDFSARQGGFSGQVTADTMGTNVLGVGTVNAATVTAGTAKMNGGNVSGDTAGFNTLGVGTVNAGQVNTGTTYMRGGSVGVPGGNVTTDPAGSINSSLFYGGTYFGHGSFDNGYLVSDARRKTAFEEVDPADVDTLRNVPVYSWRWKADSESNDDRVHVGPVAQDMPAIAVAGDDDRLAIDHMTYSGLLLALVQRQGREIQALSARLDEMGAARG